MANIIGILVLLGVYFLPFIIGAIRKVKGITLLFAINLLLGWTVIGWIITLVWAIFERKSSYLEVEYKVRKKQPR
jgi:asparagine N-glycosylation enzyme membrane subunit Stt3